MRYFILLLSLSFWTTLARSSPVTQSTLPVVYSGISTYTQSSFTTNLMTQLHLRKTGVNPAGGDNYSATVIYHLGDDGSNEYTAANYSFATVDPTTRKMVLSPALVDNDSLTGLPAIELIFNEALDAATGIITNNLNVQIGTVALRQGWDYDKTIPVEQRYGGIYDISCPEAPHALMRMATQVAITPNRTVSSIGSIGGILDNEIVYVGSVSSSYGTDIQKASTVAAFFSSARSNLVQRQLILRERSNEWICDRLSQTELLCRSSYHGACTLQKTAEIHKSLVKRSSLGSAKVSIGKPVSESESVAETEATCGDWMKQYYGFLEHRLGNQLQPIKINMRSIKRLNPSGKPACDVLVAVELSFVSSRRPLDPKVTVPYGTLVYNFIARDIDVTALDLNVSPVGASEISLRIHRDHANNFSFDWFSSLFGAVGNILVSLDPTNPELPRPEDHNSVYGLTDFYESEHRGDNYNVMSLKAQARTTVDFFGLSRNPYNGIELQGWLIKRNEKLAAEDSPRSSVQSSAYYDFYTNFFLLQFNCLVFGQVTTQGFETHSLTPGPLFSITQKGFLPSKWTRVLTDDSLQTKIRAILQPNNQPMSESLQHQYLMTFVTKLPNVKRLLFMQGSTFYSTKDWGPINGWTKVATRPVTSDWVDKKTVFLIVRFTDDTARQVELPLEHSDAP